MNQWREFMKKYIPDGDTADNNYVYAYGVSLTMLQVLKQCNGDFSRENVMKQAANLHDLDLPTSLPGIKINTSPTNYHPDPADAAAEMGRQDLGTLRRGYQRRGLLSPPRARSARRAAAPAPAQ